MQVPSFGGGYRLDKAEIMTYSESRVTLGRIMLDDTIYTVVPRYWLT